MNAGAELAALVAAVSPPSEVRRLMATAQGWDPAAWRDLAGAGLLNLEVPTAHGGAGGPFSAVAAVAEELGAALACVPFLSTVVLATGALLHASDDEVAGEHLGAMAAGSMSATLALADGGGRWGEPVVTATARSGKGAFVLDGHASHVVDGHTADLLLLVAHTPAGTGLFAVAGDAPGLTRTPLVTMDQTRKQARLELAGVPARLVGEEGGGPQVVSAVLDRAAVALAAEAVGGAQRCLDIAVAHARDRVQFGRAIGSFQAVKHQLADVLVGVESARAVADAAARAMADKGDDVPLLASTAKAWCSEAYLGAAKTTIQVHGAAGFTWDHDAHLYLKRAKSSALLFGDPAWHRRRVARLLDL